MIRCIDLGGSQLNQGNNGIPYQNRPNNGNQYPNQPNYNPNSGNQNQGSFTNQNDYRPSAPSQTNVNQRPSVSSSGVALAPFPDANSNNNYGGGNQFNYGNSQNTGARVPLA